MRRIEQVFSAGSSAPCLASCDDGSRRVVKLSSAGGGVVGLLTECVALRAAPALDAPVPDARPVWIPSDLP